MYVTPSAVDADYEKWTWTGLYLALSNRPIVAFGLPMFQFLRVKSLIHPAQELRNFSKLLGGYYGLSVPKGSRPPPLKFREFAPPPPPSVFEVLISYTLLGSKTTAKRSAISIHAPIIRDVVNETHLEVVEGACAVWLSVIFIFCELRWIANKNLLKNLSVLSSSLNYSCLKQTSWKFANTDN